MSKATIVIDLAYSSWKGQRGAHGYGELKARLKYFQYRRDQDGHIPQEYGAERWTDRGLGQSWGEILSHCRQLSSKKVLAWSLVISPAPDLMTLVPEAQRRDLVKSITEEIVESYCNERDVEVPEYAYALHERRTNDRNKLQQLHTHVILPGTVPVVEGGREPLYIRNHKGHLEQLQQVTNTTFEAALDKSVGLGWRKLRGIELPILNDPQHEISTVPAKVSEPGRSQPRLPSREIE